MYKYRIHIGTQIGENKNKPEFYDLKNEYPQQFADEYDLLSNNKTN